MVCVTVQFDASSLVTALTATFQNQPGIRALLHTNGPPKFSLQLAVPKDNASPPDLGRDGGGVLEDVCGGGAGGLGQAERSGGVDNVGTCVINGRLAYRMTGYIPQAIHSHYGSV